MSRLVRRGGDLEQVGRKSPEIEQRLHTNFIIMP
jgi:hypothetical protein